MTSYQIETYMPEFRQEIARLFTRLWSPRLEDNLRYLDWRYVDNPYTDTPLLVVARSGDTIAAVRGAYITRWRIGTDARLSDVPCVGDTIVDKQHEGQNLVQRLTRHLIDECRERGYSYLFNVSPGKLIRKISARTGWRGIGTWPTVQLRNEAIPVPTGPSEVGPWTFRAFDAASTERDADPATPIRTGPADPSLLAGFQRPGHTTARIALHRDEAFYRWRLANPMNEYRVLYSCMDREVAGYLILSYTRVYPMRGIAIVESAGSGKVQADLLREAVERGSFPLLRMWWTRLPSLLMQTAGELGFTAVGDAELGPTVIMRPVDDATERDWSMHGVDLLDLRNWEVSMFNSDIF